MGIGTALMMALLQPVNPALPPIVIQELSKVEIDEICEQYVRKDPKLNYSNGFSACALFIKEDTVINWRNGVDADYCQIYIKERESFRNIAYFYVTLEHERRHCNGWPPDHPNDWHG